MLLISLINPIILSETQKDITRDHTIPFVLS